MFVQVTAKNVGGVFLRHSVDSWKYHRWSRSSLCSSGDRWTRGTSPFRNSATSKVSCCKHIQHMP